MRLDLNESLWKTFLMKMSLTCMKMNLQVQQIFMYKWFRTETRFEAKARRQIQKWRIAVN